mmetsp:Transcript_49943/g.139882  ORF Transcript_49943/g.139882 Transcript_49943/m.139882 type:complete len:174 (-) Transcript_49943:665-1186(-)
MVPVAPGDGLLPGLAAPLTRPFGDKFRRSTEVIPDPVLTPALVSAATPHFPRAAELWAGASRPPPSTKGVLKPGVAVPGELDDGAFPDGMRGRSPPDGAKDEQPELAVMFAIAAPAASEVPRVGGGVLEDAILPPMPPAEAFDELPTGAVAAATAHGDAGPLVVDGAAPRPIF